MDNVYVLGLYGWGVKVSIVGGVVGWGVFMAVNSSFNRLSVGEVPCGGGWV